MLRRLRRWDFLSSPTGVLIWRSISRPVGVDFKGTLFGKRIMVTADAGTASLAELHAHLARYNLSWLLRRVGELSVMADGESFVQVGTVAVPAHCLPYLALVAIEQSSDDVSIVPTLADMAEAARIYNCLSEPPFSNEESDDGVFDYLIRLGYSQFAGRADLRNLIARTWTLYESVWARAAGAAAFDIAGALRAETGLNLRQLMMFGFAYSGHSAAGYMTPYGGDALGALPSELGAGLDEQARFLNWATASFSEIRQIGTRAVPGEDYDKYRLSPFLVKPVVHPDRAPVTGGDLIRLVPIPRFLVRRVTDGLYHALSTSNDRGGGNNPFRVAFGYAFQEYIGELLKAGSGPAVVLGEWQYGSKGQKRNTPDWLVLDGQRLVIIEVKQSALTLNSKMLGRSDLMAADLEKTLAEGARQLLKFRDDLQAKRRGLERLAGVIEIELLLVTHDEIPWANWIMRNTIARRVPGASQIHFCSVDDFENLQRYCWGTSLFQLLKSKREGADDAHTHDFREWLFGLGMPLTPNHPLLANAFEELIASWGAISAPKLKATDPPSEASPL